MELQIALCFFGDRILFIDEHEREILLSRAPNTEDLRSGEMGK